MRNVIKVRNRLKADIELSASVPEKQIFTFRLIAGGRENIDYMSPIRVSPLVKSLVRNENKHNSFSQKNTSPSLVALCPYKMRRSIDRVWSQ